MVIVFLDTEFTDLKNPQLLSVGMVSLDDRKELFYVELDLESDFGKNRVQASSIFVRETVLPQWGRVHGAIGTELEMGRKAGEWLISLAKGGVKVGVAFDYRTDFELLEGVIRASGIWEQVDEVIEPMFIDPMTANIDGETVLENCFSTMCGLEPHHALADAIALRECYKAMTGL